MTRTSTVPVPAGAVAVNCPSDCTVKAAGTVPKSTAAAPERAVPLTVTAVPPAAGPPPGWMPETAGGTGEGTRITIGTKGPAGPGAAAPAANGMPCSAARGGAEVASRSAVMQPAAKA